MYEMNRRGLPPVFSLFLTFFGIQAQMLYITVDESQNNAVRQSSLYSYIEKAAAAAVEI